MKFVIYGAGFRGKKVLRYLSSECIDAFIDSNQQVQGNEIDGIKVISLEEYTNNYFSDYIIVSPVDNEKICQKLDENGIYQYSDLSTLPSEFAGYGCVDKDLLYENLFSRIEQKGEIYGLTAFSLWVQEVLFERYGKQYRIVPEVNCSIGKVL